MLLGKNLTFVQFYSINVYKLADQIEWDSERKLWWSQLADRGKVDVFCWSNWQGEFRNEWLGEWF